MHTAKRTVAALAALLLASCAGDLGNYDYHALTEPVITGIDSEISVLTHARLELRPDLGEHEFPEDKYAFEWRAVSQNDNPAMTLLAETRDLEYDVELLPGSYLLLFRVIERASGVFWQAEYNLQVSESTSEGWMILCAEGAENRARLDMVSKVTGETYLDVLSGNGMPEMRNPYRIQWSRFADSESPYYLLTGDGATRLGRSGFEWKEEYRLQYEMGNSDIPAPEAVNDVTAAKMMVADGKVYYAECLVGIGLFGPVSGAAFHAAPVIGTNISTQNIVVPAVMLYDLDNKRFVGYAPNLRSDDVGGYEALHEMNDLVTLLGEMDNGGTVIGSAFERFPQGKEFVWMENTKYDPNHMYLGSRLHGSNKFLKQVVEAAGRYCDVVSINYYGHWTPSAEAMANWGRWAGKPFMITEFYTKGMDSDLPNVSGAGFAVPTQYDRAYAYQHFTLGLLEAKNCVGWQWFKYQDDDFPDNDNQPANKGVYGNDYIMFPYLGDYMKNLNYNVYELINFFDSCPTK